MDKYSDTENLQKQHFDTIAAKYAAHYGDAWSLRYRRRFINEPMFANIDLSGATVIDAMCGNGETTGYLMEKGAQVTGIDISPKELDLFRRRFPTCNAVCASILSTGMASNSCDCVVVVGGLHHLHPNVMDAISEFHRILKVGGHLCFMEPHQGSLPDRARRVWYQLDRGMFGANEAAIDLESMKANFGGKFAFVKENYKGNLAYLFVLNSLIFRIPLWLKPVYSPLLIGLEALIEKLQGKLLSCFVVCQWRKL